MLLARLDIEQGLIFIMKSCSISLLVKNDLLREGLCRLLSDNDFEIKQSVDDSTDLSYEFDDEHHIVILDYILDRKSSSNDVAQIIHKFNNSKSVVLTNKFDFDTMKKYFMAGAQGYILSDIPYKTFLVMIKLVSMGESVIPSQLIEIMNRIDVKTGDTRPDRISRQEFDLNDRDVKILERLSLGLSNKMISRELGISEATVKVAIKAIYRKLSVNNRTQAAILAREINLLPRHRAAGASVTNGRCDAHH